MILNEDYFKDLEIEDEDIIEDDVDEPKHDLTLEEAIKLHEQYDYHVSFRIENTSGDATFIQTTLIPKLFKKLDTIFELYGIEHSEYILSIYSVSWLEYCNTVVKFGNYQLFCEED